MDRLLSEQPALQWILYTIQTTTFDLVKASYVSLFSLSPRWIAAIIVVTAYALYRVKKTNRRVFIDDFAIYHPPKAQMASAQRLYDMIDSVKTYTPANKAFQAKMLMRSGLGDQTYIPKTFVHGVGLKPAAEEAKQTCTGVLDALFARTGMKPNDIDFLVVNCSVYCPTPSITAMIVNHYNMPSKVRTFQIGGMGCSASLIGVDLINDLLKANPGKNAVLVSTEVTSIDWYYGNDQAFSLQSALFRLGGAAMLFSTKKKRGTRYELLHCIRTHHGRHDFSHDCIKFDHDDEGYTAIRLSREVPKVAGKAITENMAKLGEVILPWTEKARFMANMIARKHFHSKAKAYTPNFRKAIDNFCIHTGGRGVIDTVQKNLGLSDKDVEASRATLYRYGNTSSSSVWYELAYHENQHKMRPGNIVWQIAFGSGFKANSCVLKALPGCRLNRHVFDGENASFKYSPETCPAPQITVGPEVQAAIDAFKASQAKKAH
ncbi:Very-long-chain 3-ketoacyl-CoA synthase [Carpediemonas membranifera]|uniref:3-ketoacyl-CoA synthase n=1 Tax=Carpediemonas membranifera TaxID=201153 RepID=A0A8J6AYL1_9EUKA|nr:Very-long-chain 3-ketoacyl-CoA synthase [Carpediemonas membranifera]|eukprot:KAG9391608.1 Very-long-chain 3-ketoacyl-CoA synthase [Carpediemonas membranifera]